MDHHYIEEHNIPDRYLQGKLSSTERTRFEEHFIDCAECLERLEMTEDFRGTLRTVAAEEAARSRVYAKPGLRAWLIGLSGGRQAALAAAILLLIALPSALWIAGTGRPRGEGDPALAQEWQRRYEESQQAVRNLEEEKQTREQEFSRQRLELERQLEQERQARAVDEKNQLALLQPAAPIFDLNIVRGTGAGQSALAQQIKIPRSSLWIVLKLEIEPDPELQSYRTTLLTSNQQVIWRASDLIAGKEGLAITCNSGLFKSGDYRLTLEGLTQQGRYVSAGTYSFHVIRQ